MNRRTALSSTVALLAMFVWVLISGCTTRPTVDWSSRVGNYTYDQAVLELGPPDRMTEISGGKKVADWVVGHSRSPRFSIGVGTYGRGGGVGGGTGTGGDSIEQILRLTFAANGTLESWVKTSR